MKFRFRNIFISVLILDGFMLPCHVRADDTLTPVKFNNAIVFNGIYEFSYTGIVLGRMGIETAQTSAHYTVTADIASSGILNLFVKHSSHTTVDGDRNGFTYDTHYHTRKKAHAIHLVSHDGVFTEETLVPPENRDKRPAVPEAVKKDAADPLSFILRMRQALYEARKAHKDDFVLKVYDGRRLTEADFAIKGRKTISYNGQSMDVIAVDLTRRLVAGFTEDELAEHNPHEPPVRVYFTDDEREIPIRLETGFLMSTLSATLVKECRTGESCLLGIKD